MRWLRLLAVLGLMGSLLPVRIAAATPVTVSLREDVEEFGRQMRVPGIAARLVGPNGTQWEITAGLDGRGEELSAESPFVWGSVSKSAAAAIAVGLADSGELDLSSAVREVLPEGASWVGDDVDVGDLIHHTSGLPHDVSLTDVPRSQSARSAIAESPPPRHDPRGAFRYSSLNYLLLQAVIERATNGTYSQALQSHVGRPSNARIVAESRQYNAIVPAGFVPWFGAPRANVPAPDGAGFGYGYLAGSIEALGRYAQWLAATPLLRDGAAATVSTAGKAGYGPGLYRERIAGRDVWWHSGAVPGYFTHIALFPDTGQALVLAANRYGELESNEFAAFARFITRRSAGDDIAAPTVAPATTLPVLSAIAGVAFILLGVTGTWRLSRRGRLRSARRTIIYGLLTAGLYLAVGMATWFAHSLVGVPSIVLNRWAPDLAFVLIALSTASIVTSVVMVTATVRSAMARHRR